MKCAVHKCRSHNQLKNFKKDVMFFRFPTNKTICELWVRACGRPTKFNIKNSRICSKHFLSTDYKRNLKKELMGSVYTNWNFKHLNENAVPSQLVPTDINIDSSPIFENFENTAAVPTHDISLSTKLIANDNSQIKYLNTETRRNSPLNPFSEETISSHNNEMIEQENNISTENLTNEQDPLGQNNLEMDTPETGTETTATNPLFSNIGKGNVKLKRKKNNAENCRKYRERKKLADQLLRQRTAYEPQCQKQCKMKNKLLQASNEQFFTNSSQTLFGVNHSENATQVEQTVELDNQIINSCPDKSQVLGNSYSKSDDDENGVLDNEPERGNEFELVETIISWEEYKLKSKEIKITIEAEKIELDRQKFELEKLEREQNFLLEKQERETYIKLIETNLQNIDFFFNNMSKKY